MRTLFYLSESQMERISPFFPRSHGIPVPMTGTSSAAFFTLSNMDFSGRMLLRNMVRTNAVQSVRQVEQARCFQQDLHRAGKPDAL